MWDCSWKGEKKSRRKSFSNIYSSGIADLLTLLTWVFILHLPYNRLWFCFCTNDVCNSSLLFVLVLFPTSPSPPPLPSSLQHLPSQYQPGPAQGFLHLKGFFPATAHCPRGQAPRQRLRALTHIKKYQLSIRKWHVFEVLIWCKCSAGKECPEFLINLKKLNSNCKML